MHLPMPIPAVRKTRMKQKQIFSMALHFIIELDRAGFGALGNGKITAVKFTGSSALRNEPKKKEDKGDHSRIFHSRFGYSKASSSVKQRLRLDVFSLNCQKF